MTEQQPERLIAPRPRTGHEVPLAERQHVGTDDPRELHPARRAHDEDHVQETGAEREHDAHGEQDVGDREEHVDHAHDERVGAPAEEPGAQSERDADRRRERHRGQADAERDASPVEDAAQDVATEVIGAEGMLAKSARLPHRWSQALHQHLTPRIPRRQHRREHRGAAHDEQHGEPEHRAEAQSPPRSDGDRTRRRFRDDTQLSFRGPREARGRA